MDPKIKIGYVYILSNPAMPDFIKIGYSQKNPEIRAKELSNTSVPLPYKVEHEELVEFPSVIERVLHSKLSNYRIAPDREFFRATVEHAAEELNLILYGDRNHSASFPKKVVSLLTLAEKYPESFKDKEISPKTKFRLFKTFEHIDKSFKEKAGKEEPNYEVFMSEFEDRNNPETLDDILTDLKD